MANQLSYPVYKTGFEFELDASLNDTSKQQYNMLNVAAANNGMKKT
jgi:hypothetical protein